MIACSSGSSGGGNEPPQFTSAESEIVIENSTGTILTLVATDDGDATIDYRLGSGNDEGLFVIINGN